MNKKILGVVGCLGVISAFFWGSLYVLGQQLRRMTANQPQIIMVDEAIINLAKGQELTSVVPKNTVKLETDDTPFMIILDENGEIATSTERLNGVPATPPKGVLDYAKKKGINKVTWQPKKGIREALVIKPYPHGFVVAGRSLKLIEQQENKWLMISMIMTLVTMGMGVLVTKKFFPKMWKA